jgi:hypothetical protein
MDPLARGIDRSRLWTGAVLLAVGLLLTLHRLDIAPWGVAWRWWPLLLVAAGILRWLQGVDSRREGAWLCFVGFWLLLNSAGLFGPLELRYATSWPLLVMFAGAVTLALPKAGEDRLEGLTPLAVGLWLQANLLGLFGLELRTSWPVLLILLGLAMLTRGLRQAGRPAAGSPS